jgi:HEAT repeats
MKKCLKCGYGNPDEFSICEICKADISQIEKTKKAEPKSVGRGFKLIDLGLILVILILGGVLIYKNAADRVKIEPIPSPSPSGFKDMSDIAILDALSDQSPEMRIAALETVHSWIMNGEMERVKEPAKEYLRLLEDNDYNVRAKTLELLSEVFESDLVELKLSLVSINAKFYELLEKALKEPFENVRENAAKCVGAVKNIGWIPKLVDLMKNDQDIRVRLSAARSLAGFGRKEGVDFLIKNFEYSDIGVWDIIADGLRYSTLEQSRKILEEIAKESPYSDTRSLAIISLKKLEETDK